MTNEEKITELYIYNMLKKHNLNWSYCQKNSNGTYSFSCNVCHCVFPVHDIIDIVNYRYCPNCASKLEFEEDEE